MSLSPGDLIELCRKLARSVPTRDGQRRVAIVAELVDGRKLVCQYVLTLGEGTRKSRWRTRFTVDDKGANPMQADQALRVGVSRITSYGACLLDEA